LARVDGNQFQRNSQSILSHEERDALRVSGTVSSERRRIGAGGSPTLPTARIAPLGGLSRGALYRGVDGVTKHRLEAREHEELSFSRWLACLVALSVLCGALIGILLAD